MGVGSLTKWAVPGQRGLIVHGTETRPSIDCIPSPRDQSQLNICLQIWICTENVQAFFFLLTWYEVISLFGVPARKGLEEAGRVRADAASLSSLLKKLQIPCQLRIPLPRQRPAK
jgi:hypothetical protein